MEEQEAAGFSFKNMSSLTAYFGLIAQPVRAHA